MVVRGALVQSCFPALSSMVREEVTDELEQCRKSAAGNSFQASRICVLLFVG